MSEADGLTVRYQGKLCAPMCEYSRSAGLEPSHGVVFMEVLDLGALEVKEIVPPDPGGADLKSQEKPPPPVPGSGLQSAGLLEIIETARRDDTSQIETHVAKWENILVTEKAIEVTYATDDSKTNLIKIELTDIRYMWSTRGGVSCWINVPKQLDHDDPSKTATGPEAAKEEHDLLAATFRQIQADAAQIPLFKNAVELAKAQVEADKKAGPPTIANQFIGAVLDPQSIGPSVFSSDGSFSPTGFAKALAQAIAEQKSVHKAHLELLKGLTDKLAATEADLESQRAFLEDFQKQKSAAAEAAKLHSQQKPILGDSVELIPSSTNAGKPWTVKDVLEIKILPELWGTPKLKRIPPDVAAAIVGAKVWEVILPKKALQEVLDEFQLVFVLNADSSCSIWKKDEGTLEDEAGQNISQDPVRPDGRPNENVDPRVAASRDLVTFSRVPEVVVVVGAPRIVSERVKLEPVGLRGGKIVPLVDALEGIGLTLEKAEKFALLPQSSRATLLGVFADGLKEFNRWAFKWFQLPGGHEKNTDRLPILDARAAFGTQGELLPLRVWSNSWTAVCAIDALQILRAQKAAVAGDVKKAFVSEAVRQLREASTSFLTAVVNVPFAEQSSGYSPWLDRGIIMFSGAQGPITPEGAPVSTARLLSEETRVELEYAYRLHPGYEIGKGLSFDQRYTSVWVRDKQGNAVQRSSRPLGTSPLIVHRPDFQQVDRVDGTSNKATLDKVAKALAQHQFDIALPTKGSVVEMCRPVQVELNGSVLSCTWAVNDEVPSTTAHIGSFAPLAPAPRLATRAFGDLGRFDRLAKDSTFAPHGLSQ